MLNWRSSRRALLTRGALVSVAGMGGTVQATLASPQSKNIEVFLAFCKAAQDRDGRGERNQGPGVCRNMVTAGFERMGRPFSRERREMDRLPS